ncbi:hypothetical protein G6F57_022642 [Rhizopus arrhizus]|nr:hypothetical protein G6F57_022642 [Rhizopus arrhizus]
MAALNHTDHLELAIPHPGSCYLQDHIAKELAHKVKADLLVLDSFDFISLAQQTFHRYRKLALLFLSTAN